MANKVFLTVRDEESSISYMMRLFMSHLSLLLDEVINLDSSDYPGK